MKIREAYKDFRRLECGKGEGYVHYKDREGHCAAQWPQPRTTLDMINMIDKMGRGEGGKAGRGRGAE